MLFQDRIGILQGSQCCRLEPTGQENDARHIGIGLTVGMGASGERGVMMLQNAIDIVAIEREAIVELGHHPLHLHFGAHPVGMLLEEGFGAYAHISAGIILEEAETAPLIDAIRAVGIHDTVFRIHLDGEELEFVFTPVLGHGPQFLIPFVEERTLIGIFPGEDIRRCRLREDGQAEMKMGQAASKVQGFLDLCRVCDLNGA